MNKLVNIITCINVINVVMLCYVILHMYQNAYIDHEDIHSPTSTLLTFSHDHELRFCVSLSTGVHFNPKKGKRKP